MKCSNLVDGLTTSPDRGQKVKGNGQWVALVINSNNGVAVDNTLSHQ